MDVPAVAPHDDAVAHVQAEPGTFTDVLGAEERLEDACVVLLWNARPVVGDLDQHAVTLAARP